MRWTYTLLILIHLLITTQSIAQPITVSVGRPDTHLSRREPVAVTRSKTKPRRSPRLNKPAQPYKAPPHKKANPRRAKPLPADIRAHHLKTSGYRKVAMRAADPTRTKNFSGEDADHVLEAQVVSHYLNKNRINKSQPISHKCRQAIRVHLNHQDNLKMLKDFHNQRKAVVVKQLMLNQSADKFSSDVKNHIQSKAAHVQAVAGRIDGLFGANKACSEIPQPAAGGGITGEANRMIDHANKS